MRSLSDVAAELSKAEREAVAFWDGFPDDEFFSPIGTAWSPGETVRHLTTSMRAVTRGLLLPKIVVRFMFGRADRPSRPFERLRDDYRALLGAGGTAGRFTPSPESGASAPGRRRTIMTRHHAAAVALVAAVGKWSEIEADRLRLPHPLLGKLTVREMLLFTLYHNRHHVQVVDRRRAGLDVDSLHGPAQGPGSIA